MAENVSESAKHLVDFEDSLLRLHRQRFFIRAGVFVSFSIMTVVYRLVPVRIIIVVSEGLVVLALWIWAAFNAKMESQVYNDYVKCISPSDAFQSGFKPAPLRGFFSFFVKSWDVTCFFAPFIVFLLFLLVSPARNLDRSDYTDIAFDNCIETNRLYRVRSISERTPERLYCVQTWIRDIEFWAKGFFGRIKESVENGKTEACEQAVDKP